MLGTLWMTEATEIEWRVPGLGIIASTVASAAAAGLSLLLLLTIGFPVEYLTLIYLTYTVGLSVLLHCLFFMLCCHDRKNKKKQMSKKIPRYLDYAYTAVVSVALLQIFMFAPKISEYASLIEVDENVVLTDIKRIAEGYVADECPNLGTRSVARAWLGWLRTPYEYHFTPEYCAKLKKIADASDLAAYIDDIVMSDKEFLDHPIREVEGADSSAEFTYSPIRDMVSKLSRVRALSSYHDSFKQFAKDHNLEVTRMEAVRAWLAMLLLPLGIAFRLVKTSLELFVDLK